MAGTDTYYSIPDKPVYNNKVRELQNDDPSNAQQTFNPLFRQLLENIAAVKELADSALKLANARKIGNASFDGSADITLEQMGAAASNHTHAAQTSVSGNAGTATKLQTARKIGNANFDGSANITLEQMGAAASGHTHGNMKAATASAAGTAGFVPPPAAGAQGKYLRGDGTWQTPPDTNTVYTHPTTAGNKHIPAGGSSGQILRWSSDGTAAWGADNNTTYGNMKAATASAAGGAGLVPAPAAGAQAKYLRGDGTWQNPPNTTYGNMTAATASAAGKAGLVPAPAAGAQAKYLRGDGTWQTPPDTNTVYTHPTTAGNKHIPAGGSSGQILRWSSDGTAAWGADNNTTYGNMKAATASAAGGAGLVPAPAAGAQAKYLRGDGTWQTPPNTTYGNMGAATASAAGKAGLVPAPAAGAQAKYLRGDGTWQTPPDTNTVYTHPTTAGNKHIPIGGSSGQILRWSSDGTAVWGADNNTTYSNMKAATASAAGGAGLVPAPAAGAQAKFLRGDGTWQNPPNTTYSAATQSANGLMSSSDKSKLDGINMSLNRFNLAIGLNIPSFSSRGTGAFTVVGCGALKSLTTDAIGCTAIGCSALENNGGASFNTAVGSDTLIMTCGDGNTAIGYMAGGASRKTLGNNNTLIGHMADTSVVDVNNSMALGHQSSVTASNQITLGNTSVTQLRCKVTSIASLSDKRVKEDIHPADTGICLKDVLRLPITRYKYKDFTGTNLDNHVTGWMADDYEKVFPKGVQANDEMFPVLDENGNETFEEVMETRKTINPETGEEKEVQEVRQQRKMFTLEKVKTITPTEALPTLWGAVQELAKQVAELNKLKTSG